ncbi:ribose-phosphate pyrophosphokinase-like domain-containing protein, partial [Anoxybacillus sp. LAT_38]|nr:ribose-phosphate pyrophosphokinase-like domain-containing protein [Anoxybacillus sp. LAT_38]
MANYRDPKLKVFTCNANRQLAKEIAEHIGVPLGNAEAVRFSDGECQIKLNESV